MGYELSLVLRTQARNASVSIHLFWFPLISCSLGRWKTNVMVLKFCKGEKDSKLSPSGRKLPNGRDGGITSGFNGADCIEGVASSFNGPDVPIAMAQSSMDPECVKSLSGTDAVAPAMLHVVKSRKLSTERSDPRKYIYQFAALFH